MFGALALGLACCRKKEIIDF
ncbi:MAG: hypothetical protein ACLUKN_12595 [Bacilli bacterium]